jgi:hypothetical protein
MDIYGAQFAKLMDYDLSLSGLASAAELIASNSPDETNRRLVSWLFACVETPGLLNLSGHTELPPVDRLFLEELASSIKQQTEHGSVLMPRIQRIDKKWDFLFFTRNERIWSPLKVANFFFRAHLKPSKRAAIVTSVRNEALNILEWIAHHRAMGFEEFFFYVNESDDGTVELLLELASQGICHVILNETALGHIGDRSFPVQSKCLEHAIHFLKPIRDFAWALFVDVDEFLITQPIKDGTFLDVPLNDLIERLDHHVDRPSAALFSWKWFGSNSIYDRETGLNFERFRNGRCSDHIKTFVRLARCLSFPTSHLPTLVKGDHVVDGSLTVVSSPSFKMRSAYGYGQINHYWNKSFEEFVAKRARGRDYRNFESFFLFGANRSWGRYESIPESWIAKVKRELKALTTSRRLSEVIADAERRFVRMILEYDRAHNLKQIYLSYRFDDSSVSSDRNDAVPACRGSMLHEVAPSARIARVPLLLGTEEFSSPWLRYWHSDAEPDTSPSLSCHRIKELTFVTNGSLSFVDGRWWLGATANRDSSIQRSTLPRRTISQPTVIIPNGSTRNGPNMVESILQVGLANLLSQTIGVRFKLLLEKLASGVPALFLQYAAGMDSMDIEYYSPDQEEIVLAEAVIPMNALGSTALNPRLNSIIEEVLLRRQTCPFDPFPRRVFLLQSKGRTSNSRFCANESELVEVASGTFGFHSVSIEDLSWPAQMALFAQAELVVDNSHDKSGAMVFCSKGAIIASVGFQSIYPSKVGTLRGLSNAYFTWGTESSSCYSIDVSAFSNFLETLCRYATEHGRRKAEQRTSYNSDDRAQA